MVVTGPVQSPESRFCSYPETWGKLQTLTENILVNSQHQHAVSLTVLTIHRLVVDMGAEVPLEDFTNIIYPAKSISESVSDPRENLSKSISTSSFSFFFFFDSLAALWAKYLRCKRQCHATLYNAVMHGIMLAGYVNIPRFLLTQTIMTTADNKNTHPRLAITPQAQLVRLHTVTQKMYKSLSYVCPAC